MEDKVSPKDALAVNFWIFHSIGIWVADIKSEELRFFSNVYGALVVSFLTVAYFLTEIIYVTKIWGDLESISEILFLLLTHIGTAVKLVNLLLRRERLQKLVQDSCRDEFMPRNHHHRDFLKATIRRANFENIVFCGACTSTVMAWAIVPLVETREVRRLPLKTWFPFDTTDSPIFEVIYVYQIVSIEMNACMNAMMDTFASVLMALAGAQLDMLCKDLSDLGREENFMNETVSVTKNVKGKSRVVRKEEEEEEEEKEKGVIKGGECERDKVNRKLPYTENRVAAVAKEFASDVKDDSPHRRIVRCIEHHGAIIRFALEIQEIFGIGILVQFAVSSTILCLTCFELTLTSPTSLKFYSMLLYQTCMLFQIYCYCWHGNGIIVKTSELITTAFHCSWTSCSEKFKSTLLIMMCRMQRPTKLMVGGLFGLSLETFSMILRTAYSFYAVIQRVHNGGN